MPINGIDNGNHAKISAKTCGLYQKCRQYVSLMPTRIAKVFAMRTRTCTKMLKLLIERFRRYRKTDLRKRENTIGVKPGGYVLKVNR